MSNIKIRLSKRLICIIFVIVILVIWGVSWIILDMKIINPNERGVFGDKFGVVNSLFSGLAFAGLIITLFFQKEELELQRQELAETRKELEGQKKEFEEQNKIMRRQSFENTLFNMLSLQQEIVYKLSYIDVNKIYDPTHYTAVREIKTEYNGRSVFEAFYNSIPVKYVNVNNNKITEYTGIKECLSKTCCENFAQIKEITLFDHYFRHLYRIFKYIKESELIDDKKDNDDVDDERYRYSCIVRSQLSDYELVMLFYNCISINGKDKFKPLIEDFAVFNNIRYELLVDSDDHKFYKKSAFDRKYKQET